MLGVKTARTATAYNLFSLVQQLLLVSGPLGPVSRGKRLAGLAIRFEH